MYLTERMGDIEKNVFSALLRVETFLHFKYLVFSSRYALFPLHDLTFWKKEFMLIDINSLIRNVSCTIHPVCDTRWIFRHFIKYICDIKHGLRLARVQHHRQYFTIYYAPSCLNSPCRSF